MFGPNGGHNSWGIPLKERWWGGMCWWDVSVSYFIRQRSANVDQGSEDMGSDIPTISLRRGIRCSFLGMMDETRCLIYSDMCWKLVIGIVGVSKYIT